MLLFADFIGNLQFIYFLLQLLNRTDNEWHHLQIVYRKIAVLSLQHQTRIDLLQRKPSVNPVL